MATNMSNLSHTSIQFYLIYSIYTAILFFFHHFDCHVLDDSLERKKKLSLKKKMRCRGNKTVAFIEIICGFE